MRWRVICGIVTILSTTLAPSAAAQPAPTSRLGWVTNGIVHAAAVHEQTLYVGGNFTRVAPSAGFMGPWFGVSAATGAAVPRLPLADDAVLAIEPDGAGGYFVGGRFTRIGGVARAGLAHVLADGSIDPGFVADLRPYSYTLNGRPGPEVRSLARTGTRLFVGGGFVTPASGGLVALDTTTAARLPWAPAGIPGLEGERILLHAGRVIVVGQPQLPGPQGPAAFAADPVTAAVAWTRTLGFGEFAADAVVAGGRLIVVGSFTGPNHCSAMSLDPETGAVDSAWAPHPSCLPLSRTAIHAVAAIGSTVYVGGRFTELGGQPRSNIAAIDVATGTLTAWAPSIDGAVRHLAVASGSSLYIAGAFRRVEGAARDALAEIDTTGGVTAWTPQVHSADLHTLHVTAGAVLAGGTPGVAGGVARENLAAFALDTDDVRPWAPAAPEVIELAATNGRVFASFNRLDASGPLPIPKVLAFDGETGAQAWTFPDFTTDLLAASSGHVYVRRFVVYRTEVSRVDAETGALDPSWRFDAMPWQVIPDGDHVYFVGNSFSLNGASWWHLAAVDRGTGAVSPWNPSAIFPIGPPEGMPIVTRAARMGRTMYVHYSWSSIPLSSAITAVDVESGLPVKSTVSSVRVIDMAAADGLLFTVGPPATGPFGVPPLPGAARASRPDGILSDWNPGLSLTASEAPLAARPRVLVSDRDIIVTGVQRIDAEPLVYGVAVFARQPPAAPSTLEAIAVDHAVQLSWTAAEPGVASHVVEVGSAPGASDILVQDTGSTVPTLEAFAPAGTYFVRVRAAGAVPGTAAAAPTNEIALRVGCTAAPSPPTRLAASLSGLAVTLTWQASPFASVTRYVIEAGSAAGLANLARLAVSGLETTFTTDAPPGTYFVRVRAGNACGLSPSTTDVSLTVGGESLPAVPASVTVSGSGNTYTVHWSSVAGATSYVLEAGSSPGLTDVAQVGVAGTSLGPATVQFGRAYYLRVRALSAAGVGPPSAEYVLIPR
jgi:hypothetical protein